MENDDIRDEETLETEPQEPEEDEEVEESEEEDESAEEESDEKDWEAEAKKWQAIAQRNKKKAEKPKLKAKAKKPEGDDVTARIANLELTEKKRQFGYEHGLSPEETDRVFQLDSEPSEETLKDPFVKAGLQAIRKSKRVEDNTPSSSAKSNPVISKKFKEMSPQEKDVEWQKLMKSKGVLR